MEQKKQKNIKLTLSYDGSQFRGWQIQKKDRTVQGVLTKSLCQLLNREVKINGVGRTDSGAHAISYTANFITDEISIPLLRLPYALNARLPDDIRVIQAVEVELDFHAQFSAKAREYVYFIINDTNALPMYRSYSYIQKKPLDIKRLKDAVKLFKGESFFENFTYGYAKVQNINYQRKIYYFRVKKIGKSFLFFIKGNGFLQGMIRSIISVCLNYSFDRITLSMISKALNNETYLDPKFRAPVPSSGLYFKRGYYPAPFVSKKNESNKMWRVKFSSF